MNKSRYVIHVLSSRHKAGAETVAISLITECYFPHVKFALAAPPGGSLQQVCIDNNISFIPINPLSPISILLIALKFKPSHFHCHDFRASIKASICFIFGISIISHLHQNPCWIKRVGPRSILYFLSCFFYTHVYVVSEAIRRQAWFLSWFWRKVQILPNRIDIASIRASSLLDSAFSSRSFDIAFVGRLSAEKAPMRALLIFKSLLDEYPGLKMLCIGDGPLLGQCKSWVCSNSLQDSVQFTGHLTNPYSPLSRCKLLLVSSLYEGFSLAAVEAMALGIPVVAKSVGGLREIVTNDSGCLFNSDIEAVSRIRSLLTDQALYAKVSSAAYERSLIYDINNNDFRRKLYE